MSLAGMRAVCGGLVALALWGGAAIAQAQTPPDKLVKDVANDVLRSLREDPDLRTGSQSKGRGSTVHDDHSFSLGREGIEVATVDEVHAVRDVQPLRPPPNEPVPIEERGIERMRLD